MARLLSANVLHMIKNGRPDSRPKKIYLYFFMGWLLWGLLIFPLLGKYLMGIEPDIFYIFLSLAAAYVVMAFPIHLDLPKVPDGKEFYLLFYPIVSIPIIYFGIKIREFLM